MSSTECGIQGREWVKVKDRSLECLLRSLEFFLGATRGIEVGKV